MAGQLSSDMVAQLLQAACTLGNKHTALLCGLPAADSISTSQLVQLLEVAVKVPGCAEELLRLPGAAQLRCGGTAAAASDSRY
jgi:hypothetical protein